MVPLPMAISAAKVARPARGVATHQAARDIQRHRWLADLLHAAPGHGQYCHWCFWRPSRCRVAVYNCTPKSSFDEVSTLHFVRIITKICNIMRGVWVAAPPTAGRATAPCRRPCGTRPSRSRPARAAGALGWYPLVTPLRALQKHKTFLPTTHRFYFSDIPSLGSSGDNRILITLGSPPTWSMSAVRRAILLSTARRTTSGALKRHGRWSHSDAAIQTPLSIFQS